MIKRMHKDIGSSLSVAELSQLLWLADATQAATCHASGMITAWPVHLINRQMSNKTISRYYQHYREAPKRKPKQSFWFHVF